MKTVGFTCNECLPIYRRPDPNSCVVLVVSAWDPTRGARPIGSGAHRIPHDSLDRVRFETALPCALILGWMTNQIVLRHLVDWGPVTCHRTIVN